MRSRSIVLASAAAALFVTGGATTAGAESHEGEKVKCEGVNECKGQSACQTADSECAGHNSCQGKGFLMLSEEECEEAKAEQEES